MDDTWWVRQNQLDEDQKNVFTLSIHEDYLVTGPPGSGKTNLLLLRAKQLIGSNYPNVVVVVHTRALQEFIRSGAQNYGIHYSKISTFRKLGIDLLYQLGASINLPSDFDRSRQLLAEALLSQIKSENLKKAYSCVLVDEAQDFIPEEMEVLRKLGNRFFAVADSRQKIYAGQDPIAQLEEHASCVNLRYHYRNGHKICIVADGLSKHPTKEHTLSETSKYNEQGLVSSVEVIPSDSLSHQCSELLYRLDTQLKAYPQQMIGVVCPRGEDISEVIKILKQSSVAVARHLIIQTADEGYLQFDPDKFICASKLHSAKGLEFRAFHILAAEGLKKFQLQRQLAFMGVTRAKTSLSIYHSNDLPGYFEEALSKLEPPRPPLGLEDLLIDDSEEEKEE